MSADHRDQSKLGDAEESKINLSTIGFKGLLTKQCFNKSDAILPKGNIRTCITQMWWCWGIQESVCILLACDLCEYNCHWWLIPEGEKWSLGRMIMASLALGLLTSELALPYNINSVKNINNLGNEKLRGFYELQFIFLK